jgi:hypothetical protein
VPDDRRRPERAVAEGVVGVSVGVHDQRDGHWRQFAKVRLDLGRLPKADPRVDDEARVVADHGSDRLVVELVAAHEDAVTYLLPARHPADGRLGPQPNTASGERTSAESVATPQTRRT